jgi:hypothetical protein
MRVAVADSGAVSARSTQEESMTFGLGGLAALFITARGNRPCVVLNGTTMVEV